MNYTVYIHINKTNGKVYVGITSQSVKVRWSDGSGYKPNKHFHSAIEKYGWDGFYHIVFRTQLSKEEAASMEQRLIASYKANDPSYGYNNSKGGEGGNNQGKNSGTLEYFRENSRKYYEAHREAHISGVCAYQKAHYEAHREEKRAYYETHREERCAYQKAHYEAHREEKRAYNREYYEVHKEERKTKEKTKRERKKLSKSE